MDKNTNLKEKFEYFKTNTLPEYIQKLKTDKITQKYTLCVLVASVLCFSLIINHFTLDKYEKQVYSSCLQIKEQLKNPDSFMLYDKAIFFKHKNDNEGYYTFQYGGSNSFGAIITERAICKDGNYIVDADHELEYGELNYETKLDAETALYLYNFNTSSSNNKNYEIKEIDLSKVKKKLKID